jgi:hypothetical protein
MVTAAEALHMQNTMWPYYSTGLFYSAAVNALANGTIAGAADRLDACPIIFAKPLTIDRADIEVTTGVASALARIALYNADASTGLPTSRIGVSGDLDCSTSSTTQTWSVSHTFAAYTVYWIAVHHSSNATLRGIAVGAMRALGEASTGSAKYTIARRTGVTFGSGTPDPMSFSGSFTSAIMPLVRLRAS